MAKNGNQLFFSIQEFSKEQYDELMRYAREELDIPMTASAMDEVYPLVVVVVAAVVVIPSLSKNVNP